MRESKQKKLAARGWKAGSAAEFLGLSKEEERFVELRVRLADGLRQRRLQRQLTQSDLARALRSSQSRVAKMEAGDPSVSLDLLIRSLLALGATNRDLSRLID
jgi:DNA-binding XRE family transcriptional regulator